MGIPSFLRRPARYLVLAGLSIAAASAISPVSAFADARNVTTYGVDLTAEQHAQVEKFFGAGATDADVIYVNNDQERAYLSAYIPLEQIGDKTYSCALVQPTTSGGIHVKTANLTYVTSDMIAATLATSGVKNCDVIAVCPFKVSGTGALTGVLMAYEQASGIQLDAQKKDLANQELVTTGELAQSVGPDIATLIVNDIKATVIQENITDTTVINNTVTEIVNNIINDNSVTNITNIDSSASASGDVQLTDDEMQALKDFAHAFVDAGYTYDDLKQTLEMVSKNASQAAGVSDPMAEEGTASASSMSDVANSSASARTDSAAGDIAGEPAVSEDSILNQTDDTALGLDTVVDSTDLSTIDPTVETRQEAEAAAAEDSNAQDASSADDPFANVTWDETTSTPDASQSDVSLSAGSTAEPATEAAGMTTATSSSVDAAPKAGAAMTDTLSLPTSAEGEGASLSLAGCMVETSLVDGTLSPLLTYEGADGLVGIMHADQSHATEAIYAKGGVKGVGDGWIVAQTPSGTTDIYLEDQTDVSEMAAEGAAGEGAATEQDSLSAALAGRHVSLVATLDAKVSQVKASDGLLNVQDAQGNVSAYDANGLIPDAAPLTVDDFSYASTADGIATGEETAPTDESPAALGQATATDVTVPAEGAADQSVQTASALPANAVAIEGTDDTLWSVRDTAGKLRVVDASGADVLGTTFDAVQASPDGGWLLVTDSIAHESALYRVTLAPTA